MPEIDAIMRVYWSQGCFGNGAEWSIKFKSVYLYRGNSQQKYSLGTLQSKKAATVKAQLN